MSRVRWEGVSINWLFFQNMGTVMGRLYQELGISVADEHLRRHPNLDPGQVGALIISQNN